MEEKNKNIPRRNTPLRLILRTVFSFVVFLIALELGLQAAHLVFARRRPVEEMPHPGAPVILCVGDSHTYGLYVADDETYPAQLQKLLDDNNVPANVVNRGVPGMNTSQVRRNLPRWMNTYRPRAVIVLAGINNYWNVKANARSDVLDGVASPSLRTSALETAYEWGNFLRTVKLVTLVWNETHFRDLPDESARDREGRLFTMREYDPDEADSDVDAARDRIRRDLAAIAAIIRQDNAEPVFLTYVNQPLRKFGSTDEIIRQAAEQNSVLLVDLDKAIRPLFWEYDGPVNWTMRNYLSNPNPTDGHLAAPGYKLVAHEIFEALSSNRTLIQPPNSPPPN